MKKYKLESGKGASPLYAQIKDILLSNIEEGIYKDKIPTEKQLQELFQVSRITVRQAIDELVSDGYLVRERAKGTRIVKKKIAENLNSLCNFTNEMKKKNIPYVLHSVNMSIVKADKEIADALEIEKGKNVYELHRVYYIEDEPFCSIFTYMPAALDLTVDEEVYKGSLYDYLEKEKKIIVSKSFVDIEVGFADQQVSKELQIKLGDAVLFRTRRSFDQYENHVEYTLTYYKAGKYKYSLVLTK